MRVLLLLVVLLGGSCARNRAPATGHWDARERWTPPATYRVIWKAAEDCTGISGDFDRLIWTIAPGHDFKCRSGRCIGEWTPPHTIEIAAEWETTSWVPMHEMIHDLTGYVHDGTPSNPGPRDIQIWGRQCHAMRFWLPNDDSTYKP